MTRIKNINEIPRNNCKCGSLLKHWENVSGQHASYCAEQKCIEEDVIGVYVQKADSSNTNWFIVPLCKQHISCKTELDIIGALVPSNPKESCEKKNLYTVWMNSSFNRFLNSLIALGNNKVEPQKQHNL